MYSVNVFFIFLMSESPRANWSRAMVYESIDHGNDVTCHAVLVVLQVVLAGF